MKKIYLLLLALPLLLSSCLFDDDELFDDSASERMSKTLADIRTTLEAAQNGWTIEYYPSKTQEYGGYTMFMHFSGGNKVVVASERGNADETIESMYDLVADNGPILTFNTYNDFVHYYSEPMNQDKIGPDDSGMGGDYEFMVLEATAEKITLLGKKTRNKIYMTPLAPGANWKEKMNEYITAAKHYDTFSGFAYTVNGVEATVKKTYRSLTFTYLDEKGGKTTKKASYRVVPTGIRFYNPITIGGVEVNAMDFKEEGDNYIFVDTAGSGAILTVIPPSINELFLDRTWYMALSGFSQPNNWVLIKTLIMPGLGKTLNWICLTPYEPGIAAFYFDVSGDAGFVTFTWKAVDEDKVTIALEGRATSIGLTYWQTYFFSYLARPFNGKTFTIKANNYNDPTEVLLTDVDDPTNTIKFTTEKISDPFNN